MKIFGRSPRSASVSVSTDSCTVALVMVGLVGVGGTPGSTGSSPSGTSGSSDSLPGSAISYFATKMVSA